jgi:hypothetical protein
MSPSGSPNEEQIITPLAFLRYYSFSSCETSPIKLI